MMLLYHACTGCYDISETRTAVGFDGFGKGVVPLQFEIHLGRHRALPKSEVTMPAQNAVSAVAAATAILRIRFMTTRRIMLMINTQHRFVYIYTYATDR